MVPWSETYNSFLAWTVGHLSYYVCQPLSREGALWRIRTLPTRESKSTSMCRFVILGEEAQRVERSGLFQRKLHGLTRHVTRLLAGKLKANGRHSGGKKLSLSENDTSMVPPCQFISRWSQLEGQGCYH
ncbi:hypothetical protein RRG08_054030 [Elysia crispata]|uniref:Uncharacterized protein n=1 Tax=Elysia crispata TaxID=231223 RepID=A0AAE0Z9X5_9GAST|nr:hypothetical protein RRG08_054030 [Elysia crispata]